MRTVGIDLAAEAAGTAIAVVDWAPGAAKVGRVVVGVDDDAIVAAVLGADRVGVDVPFGWPDAFVSHVVAHHEGRVAPPGSSGLAWRRAMTLRATDIAVHGRTGLTPLRVPADRIAHAALRWSAVAARLAAHGLDVRRDGAGPLVEVYPAAALKLWGLRHRGYKGAANAQARAALVDALLAAAPWLDVGSADADCRRSDHALDSVVCALVARATALDATWPPTDPGTASHEGWIHLPRGPLEALAP
jgi:hypothetical protein